MATETRLTVGSLFAGIGGFDLGFERAGFKTVWQVEIDEYCRKVLARHFPDAERFGDIRECGKHNLRAVDVICGGFPCQDISRAGLGGRDGIDGERSGLWREYGRIIGELRPKFVVVENVAAMLDGGIGRVLGDLATLGYDAQWDCLPASAFGAPHQRERIFIIADSNGERCGYKPGRHAQIRFFSGALTPNSWEGYYSPVLCRVGDGIPNGVDRLHALGNAVIPQIAQWIAERIKQVIAEFPAQPCTDEVSSGVE